MQSFQIGGSSKKTFLVFALTRHEALGYLIESFAVGITQKGQFEYNFKKVTKHTYRDYFDNPTEHEISLIEKLDKYSDENLQKRFNPKKLRTSQFYESLEHDFVANHIRTFIDKVIYEAISFMAENSINLHYKGDASERIRENQIMLTHDLVQTCFNFEKREHNTHYRLKVKYCSEELELYNKGAVNISVKPCVMLLDKRIYRFEPQWDGKKLVPFFTKEYLEIPHSSEKQFFKKFVEKSIRQNDFIAKGFEVMIVENPPIPFLQLENHWQGNIALGLYFRYNGGVSFLPGDTAPAFTRFIDNGSHFYFEKIVRNREFEKIIVAFLLDKGLTKLDSAFFTLPEIKSGTNIKQPEDYLKQAHLLIDWMNRNLDEIHNLDIQLGKEYSGNEFFTGSMEIKLDVDEKTDWFDLQGKVRFGDFEIPFMNLKSNILAGNREFILPDGTIALIPEEWMSKYYDLLKFVQKRGDRLVLKKFHYTLLEKVHIGGIKIPLAVQRFFHGKKYDGPTQLNAQLRPYQQNGYNWMKYMMESKMGGCLADDMGLGKTIQVLALLSSVYLGNTGNIINEEGNVKTGLQVTGIQLDLFESKKFDPVKKGWLNCSLIIMPLSLIHNWLHEINRFTPGLKVLLHTGNGRKNTLKAFAGYDLVLTTYGTVRNDIDFLARYYFNYIILDESQIIKNASSKIFSAIKRLESEHRMVLTGTPVENSLTDLWSQFSFINPGMLGSLKFFRDEFVVPIEKRKDVKKVEKLQSLIQPFILRRTKDQVAKELPPLTEKIHYCEMTPEQEQFYERKKSEIRNAIIQNLETKGTDKTRFLMLSGLTRLRLIANHPAIIDRDYSYGSGKYIEIVRNIEKLLSENHKVLIFSQFVKHLNLFVSFFEKHSLSYSLLTGSVAEKDRKSVIKKFQEDENRKLFLISLKAGGVGLNLTSADYVFMVDPWWNPAAESQAINRAHRIGQDKNVFVYRFITRNTVEEKIMNLQQRKSDLAGMFINQNNPMKTLDIRELTDVML